MACKSSAASTACRTATRAPARSRAPGRQESSPIQESGYASHRLELAVDALRTGDDEAVAQALALIESNKVEEVEGDPNRPLREDDDEGLDLSARCWWDEGDECWMTDFPPPPGFTGDGSRPYDEPDDDEPYERACTAEEAAILEADRAADHAAQRAEDETLRDAWFALLRAESDAISHPGLDLGSALPAQGRDDAMICPTVPSGK